MQSPVELSDAKRKLLEKLLRGGGSRTTATERQIPRRTSDSPAPLSFFQEQFWTHAQIVHGQPVFNETMTIVRDGPLDPRIVERCFVQIIGRHEIWRTTFDEIDGEPAQLVHPPPSEFPIPMVDLRHLPERERDPEALRLGEADARRLFDLKKYPLLRAMLVRTDDESYRLFMTTHHIISDGVTAYSVFLPELIALYDALSKSEVLDVAPELRRDLEEALQLPALPIQYSDFAIWQREQTQRDISARQAEFWRLQLAGDLPVLAWPNDKPRPPIQTYSGAPYRFTVPKELVDSVKELSSREGVSLYVTLFSAYAVLLNRYTGQDDIVVGSLSGTRKRQEIERLAGCFLNMLPLRFDLSGDPTFGQLLLRVRTVLLDALAHDEITFAEIVRAVRPRPDSSRNPLFQTIFSIRPETPPMDTGWDLRVEEILNGGSKLDLLFMLSDQPGDMAGLLTYNPDIFEASTLQRLVDHWQILLAQVVSRPDEHISRLEILSDAERRQLLFEFNDTHIDFPQKDRLLHELFEEQAGRTPSATAVVFEDESLTYQELNDRANQLAKYLLNKSVVPDTLVGVCLERSLNVVVALLGVLKAGGAYVPLDPNYPADRLTMIVEDSGLSLLLTQESLLEAWSHSRAELICLDRDWERIASADGASSAANTATQPQNLAYVIYTSGSTGKPKGVQITHRNLVNLILSMQSTPKISASDTLLAVTTISFDIAGLEIYVPLTVGATVVLISRRAALNAREMAGLLDRHQVTVMQAAPITWRMLIESGWQPSASLKVLVGGEALPPDLAGSLCAGASSVWNMYGPTETTIWSTCGRVTAGAPIRIGRPIANTQVYILDRSLQLLPVGAIGELCIGGDGLARGYLNRPELTAEKFVEHPYLLGDRLYRTGDLARFLPNGEIECLGRLDDQVKIRGFRIELGEIESAIAAWPGVRQTVVSPWDNSGGDKRLVAYVVLAEGASFDPVDLREAMRKKLPEYMIPASFIRLAALPLTSNGKINRKGLPAPGEADAVAELKSLAPTNSDEQGLAEIWARVLGIERVGITETFFDLGGHSLLAVRITAQAQAMFDVDLPPSVIFENPTVQLMAQAVALAKQAARRTQRPDIIPVARENHALLSPQADVPSGALVFPMSSSQQQLWVVDQLAPGSAAYNIPLAIRLEGFLSMESLQSALDSLVRRHESLRTIFRSVNGKPSQVVLPASPLAMQFDDLRGLHDRGADTERRRIAVEEARRPFDLSRGPLLSARLVRVADNDSVLILNIHHIVFDYSSIAILIRDLTALYEAHRRSAEPSIPVLVLQYPDYAVRQREWLQSASLDPQLAYWKSQLKNAPTSFELPTDHPRGNEMSFAGEFLTELFPSALLDAFESLQRREGVSLFMALLAVFDILLYRYTNQEDVVVGASTAGRNRENVDDLIGFFVNPVVMRTDLSGAPTFRELLQRVRKTATEAYDHQEMPFEKLVEQLRLPPDPSRNPLFQTMFLFQELAAGALVTPGLKWRWEGIENYTAKFDLSAYVEKRQDGLLVAFEYNTDLFERATVQRLMQHYRVLLESTITNPDESIARLAILSESEQRHLVADFNRTAVDYADKASCLHEIIERQVESTPDRTALVFEEQSLTYRQLNERSNRLAHYLRQNNVGPGVAVGVCMERSLEMEIALLAILKAGGAYMPLDPEYPPERLMWMLDDAKPPIVLAQKTTTDRLPPKVTTLLIVDSEWDKIQSEPSSNLDVPVKASDLAYIIYTSGSTGKPKGVLNVHEGIVNRLLWMQAEYKLTITDRVLQKTPFSFDVSVWELFWPLMTGSTLVMAQPGGHRDPSYLAQLILREKITTIHFVPSMLRAFLETAPIPKHSSLRQVFCSGEALSADLQTRFFELSGSELYNLYGPTEAAVDVTHWACRRGDARPFVPIGRPIANIQIYILDSQLQPVPVGVAGELHIGGIGVAHGYLNRPDLTAERFIADPLQGIESAARLYKTGDLARYLPDGEIEYLGRLDQQVKIRGFRIELGEIETAILQYAGVTQAVVVAREDTPGDKRLVAYVVPAIPDSFKANELRESLRVSLPEYMIPAAFVTLAYLPLTSSGKLDRRALPAPNYQSDQPNRGHVEPRTQTEKAMATIWAEVLQLDQIGVHDSFFQFGGHSLLAVRVFAQISRTFGKTISMNTLFQTPTIAELSRLIDLKIDAVPKNRLISIQSLGSKPPLFWFPGGAGSVLAFREASLLLGKDQPVYGLESKLPGPGEIFEDVEVRARHFVQLIQSLQPVGPYNLAGFCSGGLVAYETARLLEAQGDVLGLVALVESVPFHFPGSGLSTISYNLQHYAWRAKQAATRWHRWVAESFFGAAASNAPTHDELFPMAVQSEEAMAEVHRIEESMRQADSRYRPKPLKSRVCMLIGEDDYFGKGVSRAADPRLAWRPLLSGGYDIVVAPGDHLYMLRQPRVKIFAKKLEACLAEAVTRVKAAVSSDGEAAIKPRTFSVENDATDTPKVSIRSPR